MELPALRAVLATLLPACAVLKLFSIKKAPALLPVLVSKESRSLPLVPLCSNVMTCLAFLLVIMLGPGQGFTFDLWCMGAGLMLLLLQNDGVSLTRLRKENAETPAVIGAVGLLLLASVYRCDIWAAPRILVLLRSLLELLCILATVPSCIVLWGVLWLHEVLEDKMVVFFLPMNLFLLLTASSYTAWLLAVAGFGSGLWLMVYRLPMVPYEVEMAAHR